MTSRQPITFVTSNPHKAREVQQILGIPIDHISLELDEVQSMDLAVIARHKLGQTYAGLGAKKQTLSARYLALRELKQRFSLA